MEIYVNCLTRKYLNSVFISVEEIVRKIKNVQNYIKKFKT